MPKSIRYPNAAGTPLVPLYNGGKTRIYDDTTIYGSTLRIYGSDGETLVMSIANDDGHSGDGSIEDPIENTNGLTLKGPATIYGILESSMMIVSQVVFAKQILNLELLIEKVVSSWVIPSIRRVFFRKMKMHLK